VLAVVALPVALAIAQEAKPLVNNGGFESGLSTPWGTGQHAPGKPVWWTRGDCQATAKVDSQTKRTGKHSLHIVNQSSRAPHVYGTTQQAVSIEPNQTHQIALWAKARRLASDGAASIAVDKAWQIRPICLPKGSYDWRKFTATFTLPTATAQLRILSEDEGEVWIDDVTITPAVSEDSGRIVVPFPQLEAEVTMSERVTPEKGAVLSLPDGMRVEIPPHAVQAATNFTAKQLKVTGPEAKCARVYDFKLGQEGMTLMAPAILQLPFDAKRVPRDTEASRVKVAVWEDEYGWRKVPAKIDLEKGLAVVKTTHFSKWLFWLTGEWSEYYYDRNKHAEVHLPVPYYAQGEAGWCWITSMQMIMKYYDRDVETWSIASDFGAEFNDGLSGTQMARKLYVDFLKQYNLQTEATRLGWVDNADLTGYIMYHLSQGTPVWLAPTHIDHALVVVGFDKHGMYVNDSSGHLFKRLRGKGGVNVKRLNDARVGWEEWWRVMTSGFPTKYTMIVLDERPSTKPAVSLTVLSEDLTTQIPDHNIPVDDSGNRGEHGGVFMWDGTRTHGQYFKDYSLRPRFLGTPEYNPGNADSIRRCVAQVSNSTDKPVENGTIRLLVNDKLMIEKQLPTLPARTSNIRIDVVEDNPQCLLEHRLRPGPHTLWLALRVGGRAVDLAKIDVTIAPAQPKGLWADRRDSEILLTWHQNPEIGNGHGRLSYLIWHNREPVAQTTKCVWNHKLDANDQQEHRLQVEAFVMDGQDLNSILSDELVVPEPNKDVMVGAVLAEQTDKQRRMSHSGYSCPQLTLRLTDTTSGSDRTISGECKGVASVRDDDGTVTRFTTDLKSSKRWPGSLNARDNRMRVSMSGTVQIEHFDKSGRLVQSTKYTKAELTLEGTLAGANVQGEYSLHLKPLSLDEGVQRIRSAGIYDTPTWHGLWKGQMRDRPRQ